MSMDMSEEGEVTVYQQHIDPNQHASDPFDFSNAQPINDQQPILQSQQSQYNSSTRKEKENQINKQIKNEQDKLQQSLRKKSEEQYELKQKRRENARQEYESFMQQREKKVQQRKRSNMEEQKAYLEGKRQNTVGWKKILGNIDLQQGSLISKKDLSRMREAIIHKCDDI